MASYLVKRVLMALLALLIITCVTFIIMNLVPGGPFMSEKAPSPEVLAALEAKYGLNKPLGEQLINYLKDCGKQFSFYQIKRIIIQDDHQMNKMNQICKKTTAKQEERNILSNVINTKLEEKKRKEKLSYKKGIVLLGKEISEINVRMNRYTKPQKKSLSLYKDKQKIYKKYWDKYNIDKLY